MNSSQTCFLSFIFFCSTFLAQGQKQLSYQDKIYEPSIKTIQLYPEGRSIQSIIAPTVKDIDEGKKLILEFDDLRNDADYYYVYFIHCNADWSPSDLRSSMFLTPYNEFEIENFEFSSESKINYVHYNFQLPKFKATGNYLAVVYRDRDKKDIVLSKRFSIYSNSVGVGGRVSRSSSVANRLNNQRIEVTLNYGELKSIDPAKDFTVVVRQNERPDYTKTGLSPTFIDENAKLIRYQNLGDENDFPGGNEFLSFDISTVNSSGRNIAKIQFEQNRPTAELYVNKERDPAYFQVLDVNGKYYIRDLEGGRSGILTSEYVKVKFTLNYPETNDDIYVLGDFNLWQKNGESLMKFDTETKQYFTTQLLKQGWYDYTYWIDGNDHEAINKSFFETENLYEVFIYYRPMGARGDQLVGYSRIAYNSRR